MKYRTPILPQSKRNPTLTDALMKKAVDDVDRRIAALSKDVLSAFAAIPVYAVNAEDEQEQVAYGLSPEELIALAALIALYVDAHLVAGSPKSGFWFSDYIEESRRMGLAQSSANLGAQSTIYAEGRPIETVLLSPEYAKQTDLAVIESYNHWKGLSDDAKTQLNNIITTAVKNGAPPDQVAAEIEKRLGVTASRAKRIVDTDIPNALRESKLEEGDNAAKVLGVTVKLLWVSALTPTTRAWHASRHGKLYTSAEVRAFYSRDGNIYNCKCSVVQVIVGADGEADISPQVISRMMVAKRAWQDTIK